MKKTIIILFLASNLISSSCSSLVNSNHNNNLVLGSPTPAQTSQPVVSETPSPLPSPTTEPTITSTPNPCVPENIGAEIEEVHKIMHEFEDASLLASNTPNQQLYPAIADLQRIRREAEYLKIPACLNNLKKLQLAHMETVINTMMAFYTGSGNPEAINASIAQARQEHDAYTLEIVNLLGGIPTTSPTEEAETSPSSEATPVPTSITAVLVDGLNAANVRVFPSRDSEIIDWLVKEQEIKAFGQSEDGEWLFVETPSNPEEKAWVAFSALTVLSGEKEALPVVTPTPDSEQ